MSGRFAGQRRVRVSAVVTAVLLGVGLVTGCGSESADPKDKDWSEGEDQDKGNGQKKTGNEKPDKPKEPEEYAFVKKYIDAISEVKKGGDSSTLLEMSVDDCETCNHMAQYHEDVYDNGGEYKGDPAIEVLELVDGPEGKDPRVLRVKTQEPEISVVEESGGPEVPLDAGKLLNDFELTKEGGKWKVSEFCEVTEGQPSGCVTQ